MDTYAQHALAEKVGDHLLEGDFYRAAVVLLEASTMDEQEIEDAVTEAVANRG